jgi:uncharacterized repeat protein (TIGR03803 family)
LEPRVLLSGYVESTLATFSYVYHDSYPFGHTTNGACPKGKLIVDSQGALYGTTTGYDATSGASLSGGATVFKLPAGSNGPITFSFQASNTQPYVLGECDAGLVRDASGNFYGTTVGNGTNGVGTLFFIHAGTTAVQTVYDFGGSDGANPGGLVSDAQGNIYGTTSFEGASDAGTIFEVTNTGYFLVLASFDFSNGSGPSELAVDAQGNLYGATEHGGVYGYGDIFELPSGSSTLKVLYSFTGGSDGSKPVGGLVRDTQGDLYGTTSLGGVHGDGTVFELDAHGLFGVLSFNGANGYDPVGDLALDGQGNLFGTTYLGGAQGCGTVFEVRSGSGVISTLYSFNGGNDGANPVAGPTLGPNGSIYGTTLKGGANGYGTVFKLTPIDLTSPATFEDASGDLVTVALSGPGTGDITFASNGDMQSISLKNTTALSSLTITAKATVKGVIAGTTLGGIDTNGAPLGNIMAPTTDLYGAVLVGASPDPKASLSMTFDQIRNASIQTGMPLKALTASEWLDDDGTPDVLAAPAIGTISITGKAATTTASAIRGDFMANLTLSGAGVAAAATTLGTVNIKGNVGPDTWDVTGKVGSVTVAGTIGASGNPWVLKDASTVTGLVLGDVVDGTVSAGGLLSTVTAKRWQAGSITAPSLTTLNVNGSLAVGVIPAISGDFQADLALSGVGLATTANTLGTANIKGNVGVHTWDVAGRVGTLTVAGTVGSSGNAWVLKDATTVAGLTLGDVVDGNVMASGAIGTVSTKRWRAGSLDANGLTTLNVTGAAAVPGSPAIRGDFGANLILHGQNMAAAAKTLGTVTVKGNVAATTWDVTGAAGNVTISGAVSGWDWGADAGSLVTTSAGALSLGDVASANVVIAGPIGAVSAIRWQNGLLQATHGTTLAITGLAGTSPISGDFGADLRLTQATLVGATPLLTTMTVAGWLSGASIMSAGPLGTVTVGGMNGSGLWAGVKDAVIGLPAAAGDFNVFTTTTGALVNGISSLTIKGIAGQTNVFINSTVASYAMGTVVVTGVQTDNSANGGTDFGLIGHAVTSYKRNLLAPVKLTGPQADQIDRDFVLRLV